MTDKISILLPEDISNSRIQDFLSEHIESLWGAFDLELPDDRAELDDVTLDEVEVFEDAILIDYRVEYSVYYGCKDMNYAGDDVRLVEGKRKGATLEFDQFVPPEPRTTFEEF